MSPDATLARVSLYTVDFLSLLATVLFSGTGSNPVGPPNLGDTTQFGERAPQRSGSFLDFFRFPLQGRQDSA